MKKVLLIFLLLVFVSSSVSAIWTNTTFNNSLGTEDLNYNSSGNFTRWLAVPESVDSITKAFLNFTTISGFSLDGLLGYYDFNETSGINLPETNEGKLNATLYNMEDTDWVSGIVGNALHFDGVDEYGLLDGNNSLNLSKTNEGSLSIWAKASTIMGDEDRFITHGTNNIFYIDYQIAGGEGVGARIRTTAGLYNVKSSITTPFNDWIHIVATFNTTTLSIYINGTLSGTTAISNDNVSYTGAGFNTSFATEPSHSSLFSNVSLDDVTLWNKTLTSEEVLALYNAPGRIVAPYLVTNPYLEIGTPDGTREWSYTGEFNQADNKTSNLFQAVNSYLSGCTIQSGFCLVPFLFHSDTRGILRYLDLIFSDDLDELRVGVGCTDAAYYFDFKDEENLTSLEGATVNYNFKYGLSGNGTSKSKFGTLTNINNFSVCINSTESPNWTIGAGEIQYSLNNYVDRRYYTFDGSVVTNNTNNITLYNLLTASQTSFKLEVSDTSLTPFTDKFTTLLRWYPQLNEYRVVEMSRTDENGDSVIHVRPEDVDYRIGVYERNGTLIKLEDPTRFVCLVDPCTYTLKISPTDTDFTSFFDVDHTFTYNTTTGIWLFIYSDSSQKTSEMNLTVYKVTGTSIYPICSNTASGFSGVITCNTSAFSGSLRGEVYRSASPEIPIAQKIIKTTSTPFKSTYGLWVSLIIGIPIAFIFALASPVAAVIGGVIMMLPALYFGAINWTIMGGVAVLGGIVMHFLKRIG